MLDKGLRDVVLVVVDELFEQSRSENVLLAGLPVVCNLVFAVLDHVGLLVEEQTKSFSYKLHRLGHSLETLQFSDVRTLQAVHGFDCSFVDRSDLLQLILAFSVLGLSDGFLLLGRLLFDFTLGDGLVNNLFLNFDLLLHLS